MIKSKIFVRFALLGVLISASMLVVSFFTTQWMRDLIFDEPFRDRGPFRAVEHVLENMTPADRVQGLIDLLSRGPRSFGPAVGVGPTGRDGGPNMSLYFDFVLLDQHGKIIFPADDHNDERKGDLESLFEQLDQNPRQVDASNDRLLMRRLIGKPTQFLARGVHFRPPAPAPKHFVILLGVQMFSILIAVLLTLAAVLFSIRQRATEAEQVIAELGRGNLKARIPISKMDEVGTVMFAFNKMADEIEHLIEHLRKTEHARRDLLRELAHDLRTPVASLKSLIETVSERADQLPKEKLRELLDLAMREADYFEGLVDDLLFLGRVQEPKYKTNPETFDIRQLLQREIESSSHRHRTIKVELDAPAEVSFDGDPGLIKRLVRNAIENAVSFAHAKVIVKLRNGKDVEITVSDDGPGFDPASLASFGQRKYSRAVITEGSSKRISIGLGSVIMKSITDAYRGELRVSNRVDETTRDVLGAEVSIRLPQT